MQKSIMIGNYEFYYAAGLLKKLLGLDIDSDMKPVELHASILEQIKDATPPDEKTGWLFTMLGRYEPGEDYDAQMQELFAWGEQEPDLWQVATDFTPNFLR
jgi:hypothetical protein